MAPVRAGKLHYQQNDRTRSQVLFSVIVEQYKRQSKTAEGVIVEETMALSAKRRSLSVYTTYDLH